MNGKFKDYFRLIKFHLCLYIALSGVFGHAAAVGRIQVQSIELGLSVLLLAFGAAILNNIQDRAYDRFFPRTSDRPLPQKKIPVYHAIFLSAGTIVPGLYGIFLVGGWLSFALGVSGIVCYNLIYTPLKKKSLLAVLPGSLCGMVVPLIGWTAAGRSISSSEIIMIMSVFGIWQIPHFFLTLLKYRTVEKKPHTSLSVFPDYFSFFSEKEIKLQVMIWTCLYVMGLFLFVLQQVNNFTVCAALANIILVMTGVGGIWFQKSLQTIASAAVNVSILIFMGTGILKNYLV